MRAKLESCAMETERLLLRRWHRRALQPFARINNDPRVMEFFPSRLSPTGSDAFAARIEAHFQAHGFGLWALELRQEREFIGFAGLAVPALEAHFTPCVEIGWRLDPDYWGCGLATEAARAAVDYAFHSLN